jgi:Fic-DOC domain mobile mystery protein B
MFDGEPDGATPLDPDEADALIPAHLHTRRELNEWEQANILSGAEWARTTSSDALDESTIRELHRRMFDKTWEWAGSYRTTDKNLGGYWAEVPAEVKKFVDDGRYWIENETFPRGEAAARLHHRLVMIHPFPNGNGRHARAWCDLLMRQNGLHPFEWKTYRCLADHVRHTKALLPATPE